MKKIKNLFILILALCMTLSCVPILSLAAENSCGDEAIWTYDSSSKTIIVSGTGATYDYSDETPVPWNNYDVEKIIITNGITTVGNFFFTKGSSIELSNTTIINSATFANSANVTTVNISNNPEYKLVDGVLFNSDMTELVYFPAKKHVKNYTVPNGVTTISQHAFNNAYYLQNVVLPDTVTTISDYAFDHARVFSVNIPEGVTYLGSYVFNYCGNLNNVVIPSSVTFIRNRAFFLCDDLTNLTLSEGLMMIGDYAFANCHKLQTVTMPESLMIIGPGAFEVCENLTNVTLNNNLMSIGKYAFAVCSGLTHIIIPDSVGIIEEGAFYDCAKLNSIILEDGVFGIGMLAFAKCPSLTEMTLPESIAELDVATFMNDANLAKLYILNKEAIIKTLSNEVTIPSTTTIYGYCAPESILENYKWFIENENNEDGVEKKTYNTLYQFVTKNSNNFVSLNHICNEDNTVCSVCNKTIENNILVENITPNKSEITLTLGESTTLTTNIAPSNATNKTLTYTSSNENIIKVNSAGKITTVNPGTAIIKITATSGIITAVKVTVNPVLVKSIATKIEGSINYVDDTAKIIATVSPSNATNKNLIFSSSNNNVINVDTNGNLKALREGTATIRISATDASNVYTEVTFTVKTPVTDIPVETVSIEVDKSVLTVGEYATITAYVTPEEATNKTLKCTSSNTNVVKIGNGGKLIAVAPGEATITVAATSGAYATVKIFVQGISVTNVSATANKTNLLVGETTTITTTVSPSNASNKNLIYKSLNENVIKVDSQGKITAVGAGNAIVTVTSTENSGKYATITFTVNHNFSMAYPSKLNINTIGNVSLSSFTGTPAEIIFTSSNNSVFTIDENGAIAATGTGSATITTKVIFADGFETTKSATIKVIDPTSAKTCSMCETYENSKGTPMETFYMIIHAIVHFFATLFV